MLLSHIFKPQAKDGGENLGRHFRLCDRKVSADKKALIE